MDITDGNAQDDRNYYEPGNTAGEAVERLKTILSVLRGEQGCPWDRAQDHKSLKRCLIEEAYEVTEAIDREDVDNLEEELGDVLLQVVFHSHLGEEQGEFDLKSVANRICEKMIRRHPHVFQGKNPDFSNNPIETVDKVLERWENVKRQEHEALTVTESMRKIPRELPSLLRSEKIQKKAADVGFDWDDMDDAFAKVREETEELFEIRRGTDMAHIQEEVGDLLFSVVNAARFLKVDPENALYFTSCKFINRFSCIEEAVLAQGKSLSEMSLSELDKLWNLAKESERQTKGQDKPLCGGKVEGTF